MASSSAFPARATPRKRSAHEIALSTEKVQLCDGHEARQVARGLVVDACDGTHMPEFQDWYKERIGTTTGKRSHQDASSYMMGHCIYKCEHFRDHGFCLLTQNTDNGFVVGQWPLLGAETPVPHGPGDSPSGGPRRPLTYGCGHAVSPHSTFG